VRHLVLPGFLQNSVGVLKLISEELSPNLHISIMSQYYPTEKLLNFSHPKLGGVQRRQSLGGGLSTRNLKPGTWNSLSRPIAQNEYKQVLDAFHSLGFSHGWLQEYDSHDSYRPNFSRNDPFSEGNF
jgi:putative pyruvate formate lyase activating enzyme